MILPRSRTIANLLSITSRSQYSKLNNLGTARFSASGSASGSRKPVRASQGSRDVSVSSERHIFTTQDSEEMPKFELLEEKPVYKRYLSMFDRRVRVTSEATGEVKELHYDVVGHPKCDFKFAVTVPFHPATDSKPAEITLIREYCQGPNTLAYNLPTGGFEPSKHKSIEECAAAELSEEALLHGGELVRLIPEGHPGFAEVKWCANRFVPFLCIDPQADPAPGVRDAEEYIQVLRVPVPEFRQLLVNGDMMLPSVVTGTLALQHLESRGLLQPQRQ